MWFGCFWGLLVCGTCLVIGVLLKCLLLLWLFDGWFWLFGFVYAGLFSLHNSVGLVSMVFSLFLLLGFWTDLCWLLVFVYLFSLVNFVVVGWLLYVCCLVWGRIVGCFYYLLIVLRGSFVWFSFEFVLYLVTFAYCDCLLVVLGFDLLCLLFAVCFLFCLFVWLIACVLVVLVSLLVVCMLNYWFICLFVVVGCEFFVVVWLGWLVLIRAIVFMLFIARFTCGDLLALIWLC